MESDLLELYQDLLLEHSKRPKNFGVLNPASTTAEGRNPLCGDQIRVYINFENERISELKFEGFGCAISKASASLMSELLVGKARSEVIELFDRFHELVTKGEESVELGDLQLFSNLKNFPMRVKCASLAWHAVKAAINGSSTAVSTE